MVEKKVAEVVAEEAQAHPGVLVEAFSTDEHRLGLKPVVRWVWEPIGARPTAPGHHRFEWLYVTAFVSPATGECFWYVSNGVSKPFFEQLLAAFADEAGAGRDRIIVLVLDNAGWHSKSNLRVPDGIRLLFSRPICRASAGRASLGDRRRTHRQQTHPRPRNPRSHCLPAVRRFGQRASNSQGKNRFQMVAQNREYELITRKSYHTRAGSFLNPSTIRSS